MKTIKLIKHNTNIEFLKFKKATLIMSIAICFFSIFSLFLNGLNFGIDFKGGTLIEVSSENSINISNVRSIHLRRRIAKKSSTKKKKDEAKNVSELAAANLPSVFRRSRP